MTAMDGDYRISTFGLGLLYCGAAVLIIAGLRASSSVVVPLLLAAFINREIPVSKNNHFIVIASGQ